MPRSVDVLPDECASLVTEDRKWRQEKLYKQMTDRCIDEVAEPLRRLELMPEELVTLKIIMLFNYGNHAPEETQQFFITDETRKIILEFKDRVVNALFANYRMTKYKNYEGEFTFSSLLILYRNCLLLRKRKKIESCVSFFVFLHNDE
jgi:hypothetical protein